MSKIAAVLQLLHLLLLLRGTHALMGGGDAVPNQFPYQVLTSGFHEDPTRQFGTGVLIHPEWVLTTAESVADFFSLSVTLGVVERNSTDASRQDIPARRVVVHPKWQGRNHWKNMYLNDVALVKLSRPATLNAAVQLAYLPRKYHTYNGDKATTGGWGTHATDRGYRTQNHLKWEETSIIGFVNCFWKRFSVSEHTGYIRFNHICADTKGTGPCYNDGGAPLTVLDDEKRPIVVGIFTTPMTYSEFCGSDYPAVYTRVSSHLDWIQTVANVTAQ